MSSSRAYAHLLTDSLPHRYGPCPDYGVICRPVFNPSQLQRFKLVTLPSPGEIDLSDLVVDSQSAYAIIECYKPRSSENSIWNNAKDQRRYSRICRDVQRGLRRRAWPPPYLRTAPKGWRDVFDGDVYDYNEDDFYDEPDPWTNPNTNVDDTEDDADNAIYNSSQSSPPLDSPSPVKGDLCWKAIIAQLAAKADNDTPTSSPPSTSASSNPTNTPASSNTSPPRPSSLEQRQLAYLEKEAEKEYWMKRPLRELRDECNRLMDASGWPPKDRTEEQQENWNKARDFQEWIEVRIQDEKDRRGQRGRR